MNSSKIIPSVIAAVVLFCFGILTLVYKSVIVTGKLTGHAYKLDALSSVLIASAFFLLAIFMLLVLSSRKQAKVASKILLVIAFVFYTIGYFR